MDQLLDISDALNSINCGKMLKEVRAHTHTAMGPNLCSILGTIPSIAE